MRTSEAINELVAALVAARAHFGSVKKNAKGQVGQNRNYRYADLTEILDVVTEPLLANGLALTQAFDAETSSLVTRLMHVSGQWIEAAHPLPKYDRPQDFGSAATYARRYSLQALLCLSADDDDGATAQKSSETRKPEPVRAPIEPTVAQIADALITAAEAAPLYVANVKPHEKVKDVQWYALTFSDGRTVYTRDADVVALASDFRGEHAPVTLTTKPTKKGSLVVEYLAAAIPYTERALAVASVDAVPF